MSWCWCWDPFQLWTEDICVYLIVRSCFGPEKQSSVLLLPVRENWQNHTSSRRVPLLDMLPLFCCHEEWQRAVTCAVHMLKRAPARVLGSTRQRCDTGLWVGNCSVLREEAESRRKWEPGQKSWPAFSVQGTSCTLNPSWEGSKQFCLSVVRGCSSRYEERVSWKALFPNHLQFGYHSYFFLNWTFPLLSAAI